MLNNLFSSFDTKNFMYFSFMFVNLYIYIYMFMFKKMNKEYLFKKKMLLFIQNNISNQFLFKIMFIVIFLMNLLSLNFFMFNLTSQVSNNLMMIFILWLPVLMMSISKMNNYFLVHILPMGVTGILIPTMIIIEMISFMIRPLTLFLRLSINMIAGHVLMSLINNMFLNNTILYFLLVYVYMLMKFLISFIQSYIIFSLMMLYMEEI